MVPEPVVVPEPIPEPVVIPKPVPQPTKFTIEQIKALINTSKDELEQYVNPAVIAKAK